jgi:hypothetical protein
MQEISQRISIGSGPDKDMHLRKKVTLGDRTLVDGPCRSVTLPFALIISMGLGNLSPLPSDNGKTNAPNIPTSFENAMAMRIFEVGFGENSGADNVTVDYVDTTTVPAEVHYSASNMSSRSRSGLMVVDSEFAPVNGIFYAPYYQDPANLSDNDQYWFDDRGNYLTPLYRPEFNYETDEITGYNAVDLSGQGYADQVSFDHDLLAANDTAILHGYAYNASFANVRVHIAQNNKETRLHHPIMCPADSGGHGNIDAGGRNIVGPQVSPNESEILISTDITNNRSSDFTVGSVGLNVDIDDATSQYDDLGSAFCIARDKNSFVIPAGQTINVAYSLFSDNSGGGGLMNTFMQAVRSIFQGTNFNIDTIDGGSAQMSNNNKDSNLQTSSPPGEAAHQSRAQRATAKRLGYDFGPVVGQSTQPVDNAQVRLPERVEHGAGTGELWHYGCGPTSRVVNRTIDSEGFGSVEFSVERLFENRSGSSIDITETGLYASVPDENDSDRSQPCMVARHLLNTTTTVPAGEILKVTYDFVVEVPNPN